MAELGTHLGAFKESCAQFLGFDLLARFLCANVQTI